MARQLRSTARSSPTLRLALLAGLVIVVRYGFGSTFSVKGSWDGAVADVSSLPNGLGPKSVGGIAFDHQGLSLAANDGHLKARYASGPMSLSYDDSQAWQANFSQDGTSLRVSGHGSDDLSWAASRQSNIDGLGDVEVNVSSGDGIGVSLARDLPELAGLQMRTLTSSHGEGLLGRLEARRALSKDLDMSYSVENGEEGDYSLSNLKHDIALAGSHKDGSLAVSVHAQGGEQLYNATYAHDLGSLLKGDAGAVVGVDNAGVYGRFAKSHDLGSGLSASYDIQGRSDTSGSDLNFAQAVRLSHELGSLRVVQGSGKPVEAQMEVGVVQGPARLDGKLGYALGADAPSFNLTVSSDLADALNALDAEGELQLGIDDASADGLYARVAARRQLGNGLALQYSSQGRAKALEHSLKVSNDLGFAELVHAGSEPRLRLGYQIDA